MEREFIIFFLNHCLNTYFKSKVDMAKQLKVGVSTLMRVMNPPYKFKASCVPFQNAICYCLRHDVDLKVIFEAFEKQYPTAKECGKHLALHAPSLCETLSLDRLLNEIAKMPTLNDAQRQSFYSFAYKLNRCLCSRCTYGCFYLEEDNCLALQLLRQVVSYRQ